VRGSASTRRTATACSSTSRRSTCRSSSFLPARGRSQLRPRTARRVAETVSLADVAPTLLDLVGAPVPASADGRSLRPRLAGERALEERPAYSETYYPRFHFAWSDLQSLQDGRWKLIESSDPELYDLSADPGEARNLAASQRDRYLAMRRQLETLRERWRRTALNARPAVQDPESVRKLASLGYLTGGSEPERAEGPLPSPRGKIGIYNLLNSASALAPVDPKQAEAVLREILAADPNVVDARTKLANVCLAQGRVAEAVPLLETAVRERPADVALALALASALESTGRGADAAKFLESRVSGGLEDGRLDFMLGTLAEKRGDRSGADSWFERAAAREPRSAARRSAMAELLLARGDLAGAAREASAALELDPRVAGAHWVLARAAEAQGRAPDALNEYGAEIAVDGSNERSFGALGAVARRLGVWTPRPSCSPSRCAGTPTPCGRGCTAPAISSTAASSPTASTSRRRRSALSPNDRQSAFACFLLADLYSRLGDARRSEEFARKAKGFATRAGSA
jgi:tetratricopeptide (TPR) repeat protein